LSYGFLSQFECGLLIVHILLFLSKTVQR